MIITYNTTTFVITVIDASNPDPILEAGLLAYHEANKSISENVFTISDDAPVLSTPSAYRVVETLGVPTGTELAPFLELTPSANPINLDETITLAFQLKDKYSNPELTSGVTVTISVNNGIIRPSSFVTDANGENPSPITYAPGKFFGIARIETTVSDNRYPAFLDLSVHSPATDSEQNWLQANDIKPAAITADKVSGDVNVAKTPISYMGLTSANTSNCNSIVVDASHVYVNYLDGATPTIAKLDKNGRFVVGSVTYVDNNLLTQRDGMADDGTDLWVSAGSSLLQVNKAAMTITNTFVIDATGGKLEFMVNDGASVWSYLYGGSGPDANRVIKITKATGIVAGNANPRFSGTQAHYKQAWIYNGTLYTTHPPNVTRWAGIDTATLAVSFAGGTLQGGSQSTEAIYVAGDGTLWAATVGYTSNWGNVGITFEPMGSISSSSDTDTTSEEIARGTCYELCGDTSGLGSKAWGIFTRYEGATGGLMHLREMILGSTIIGGAAYAQVQIARTIDASFGVDGEPGQVIPRSLATDGKRIYIANSQNFAIHPAQITVVEIA